MHLRPSPLRCRSYSPPAVNHGPDNRGLLHGRREWHQRVLQVRLAVAPAALVLRPPPPSTHLAAARPLCSTAVNGSQIVVGMIINLCIGLLCYAGFVLWRGRCAAAAAAVVARPSSPAAAAAVPCHVPSLHPPARLPASCTAQLPHLLQPPGVARGAARPAPAAAAPGWPLAAVELAHPPCSPCLTESCWRRLGSTRWWVVPGGGWVVQALVAAWGREECLGRH